MTSKSEIKSLTLRLPESLYSAGNAVAGRRKVSMNALVCESLAAYLREEEDRALFDAFTQAGESDDAEIEFAFEAQADVAR